MCCRAFPGSAQIELDAGYVFRANVAVLWSLFDVSVSQAENGNPYEQPMQAQLLR